MEDPAVLERALVFALERHGDQTRKWSRIPYVSHLMAVAALVLEDGGAFEDAAAALLHDVVEDTETSLGDVRAAFGDDVARIVEGCSDSFSHLDKQDWRPRKEAYLERLRKEPPEVLRVSVADKLHNARSIVADLREQGPPMLERFNGKREGTLWYYRTLIDTYRAISARSRWLPELERTVDEMVRLAGPGDEA